MRARRAAVAREFLIASAEAFRGRTKIGIVIPTARARAIHTGTRASSLYLTQYSSAASSIGQLANT
jgi:hypothetical protein